MTLFVVQNAGSCPYNCSVCVRQYIKYPLPGELPDAVWDKIVSLAIPGHTAICFGHDSDPFDDPKLADRLYALKQKGISADILSIAYYNVDQLLNYIQNNLFRCVDISIPGGIDFTEVTGLDFTQHVDNIKQILSLIDTLETKPKFTLRIVTQHIEETEKYLTQALSYFVHKDMIRFQMFYPDAKCGLLKPFFNTRNITVNEIQEHSKKYPHSYMKPQCIRYYDTLYIHNNGAFQLCCQDYFSDRALGNIMDMNSLKDIHAITDKTLRCYTKNCICTRTSLIGYKP